jgi:uncharacterized damage-inducible protein DinB
METKTATVNEDMAVNADQIIRHWQGHRNLTRKVIEAFPEDALFNFSIGGMRPFSELALEMIMMAAPGMAGIATGKWEYVEMDSSQKPKTKAALLKLWDEVTEKLNELAPRIPPGRFQQNEVAFGQYEGTIYNHLFYLIDNEIHHRGQGYVYLRALNIEPPFFWERE